MVTLGVGESSVFWAVGLVASVLEVPGAGVGWFGDDGDCDGDVDVGGGGGGGLFVVGLDGGSEVDDDEDVVGDVVDVVVGDVVGGGGGGGVAVGLVSVADGEAVWASTGRKGCEIINSNEIVKIAKSLVEDFMVSAVN